MGVRVIDSSDDHGIGVISTHGNGSKLPKSKINYFQDSLGRLQSSTFAFRNVLGFDAVQLEFPCSID